MRLSFCCMTLRENLSQSPTILGMTNSSTAVMGMCVVFRLVEWMYVIDTNGSVILNMMWWLLMMLMLLMAMVVVDHGFS